MKRAGWDHPSQLRRSEPAQAGDGPLEVIDLLNDLETLAAMLRFELDRAMVRDAGSQPVHVLDAFLLAAGMCQVAEDHLHRRPRVLEAIGRRLQKPGFGPARGALHTGTAVVDGTRKVRDRDVARWHSELVAVLSRLAEWVMKSGIGPTDSSATHDRAIRLVASVQSLPASLRRDVLRLPDSFRTFDQRPEDCDRLAARFARMQPDRDVPLVVVGVRTSGSYLAPLQAVALAGVGYRTVGWMTYRPGHDLLSNERHRLDRLRRNGGMVLVIDDPPVTGNKLARTADALGDLGIPVVLLIPLLGEERSIPAPLRERAVVALPWSQWAFHDQLENTSLTATVRDLLEGTTVFVPGLQDSTTVTAVHGVTQSELDPIRDVAARPLTRSHLRSLFSVDVSGGGHRFSLDMYVKGTGLGYFGRHSAALSRDLDGFVPDLYGWHDGFLFRRALPEPARLISTGSGPGATHLGDDAAAIAEYIAVRARRLPAGEDMSLRLRKRHPVWELAADVLADGFGRAAPLAAPLMRQAAIRVLDCPAPSVVDGSAALPHWFRDPATGRLLKVDYDERAFSVWDKYCYDPVWDLAVAAGDHDVRFATGSRTSRGFAELLRTEYQATTGEAVSSERWFLYRTVYVLSLRRHFVRLLRQGVGQLQTPAGSPPASPDGTEVGFEHDLSTGVWACDEAMARSRDQYLAALFLADARWAPAAPAGVPCAVALRGPLTWGGALGLRALMLHGYRPLLVTDSSLHRLEQQVHDFGAAGGVGEHGTVSYESSSGRIGASIDAAAAANMALLPATFEGNERLVIPPGFAHIVRVCAVDHDGQLERPGPTMAWWTGVTRRDGTHHVDLVPPDHDEIHATRALLTDLGDGRVPTAASSVGQIRALLGHLPGGCPVCLAPPLSAGAEVVLNAIEGAHRPIVRRLAGTMRSLQRWED